MINSPFLVAYKLGLYPNWKAKERILVFFLKGLSIHEFKSLSKRYTDTVIPDIFSPKMFRRLKEHQANGDEVIVVSASPAIWVAMLSAYLGVRSIGTELEVKEGVLTGRIAGKNCYGPEKVVRISQIVNLSSFGHVFAYGNSRGDREMLSLAR